jgi:hypothetical protein
VSAAYAFVLALGLPPEGPDDDGAKERAEANWSDSCNASSTVSDLEGGSRAAREPAAAHPAFATGRGCG